MRRVLISLFLLIVLAIPGLSEALAALPTKAIKYHSVLVKRPAPGYLFDRFYNAWLDESSIDELEEYLVDQSTSSSKSADGLLLAFFYAKKGDDVKAIEQFRMTLENDPGNAVAWYQKAILESRSLDFKTALTDLAKASAAKPSNEYATRISKLRAKLLLRNQQREEALAEFRKLLADNPDDEALAEDLIELQLDEGLYKEATTTAEELIKKSKDPYQKVLRRLRLGDIRQRSGDRSKAIEIYSDTLKNIAAGSWLEREILSQIERAYRKEGDTSGLKQHYVKLLESHPRRVAIRRGYALVLADTGSDDEAVKVFGDLLDITPGDRGNQEAFVALLVRLEKLDKAHKQIGNLIKQNPEDSELYIQLAELSAKTKKIDEATSAVADFLKRSDQSEYSFLRAARLFERLKIQDAAKKQYEVLTDTFADSPSAKEARAAFLYKVGDKEHAIELWKSAANGGDAEQSVRVAKALAARQEHEEAYGLLNKHVKTHSQDGVFLSQLIKEAIAVEKHKEVIPLSIRRVDLATEAPELLDAVSQAGRLIDLSESIEKIVVDLRGDKLTTQRSCLLSELYERSDDCEQADRVLKPMVESGDLLAISQQIRLAKLRRDWSLAIGASKRLLEMPGGLKSRNIRQLIEFHERDYEFDKAIEYISEWKKISPGSVSPWLTESRLLRLNGEEDEAIEVLRTAMRQFDSPREVRGPLAGLYQQTGKIADAERIFWSNYEEGEDFSTRIRAVEQLARLANMQDQVDALVANFEERRKADRKSIEPLMALAAIHRVANNHEERLQVLGEAVKLRSDDVNLLKQVARIQEKEGDWEQAQETLTRAMASDKTDSSKRQLIQLLLRWGSADEADALLNQMLLDNDPQPREVEVLADAMVGTQEWERVRDFLSPQVDKWPEDYRLRYMLAISQEELDECEAAAENFLAVLMTEEEIQLTPTQSQNAHISHPYYTQLKDIAPPGLEELLKSIQSGYSAYQYRQQQNQGMRISFSGMGGSGLATRIQMPHDLEMMRHHALRHLATVITYLTDEEMISYEKAASKSPLSTARFVLGVEATGQYFQVSPVDLIEAFPEEDVIRAFAIIHGHGSHHEHDFYQKSFEVFSEEWPELALMAYFQGVKKFEEMLEKTEAAKKLFDRIDSPSYITAGILFQAISSQFANQGDASHLPVEFRESISSRLNEWYRELRDTQYGASFFGQMANLTKQVKTPKAFLQLLQDEVIFSTSSQKKNMGVQNRSMMQHFQRQGNYLSKPSYPPVGLNDIPLNVISLLVPEGASYQQSPYQHMGQQSSVSEWDKKEIVPELDQIKNPQLRMLLAAWIDEVEVVEKTLAELLAVKKPKLDTYLLAASWAAHKEEDKKAIQILKQARYLPMGRAQRNQIDRNLLALVLDQLADEEIEAAKEEPASDSLLAVGRETALRLRHGKLEARHQASLTDALETLGLKKEAERLANKTTALASSGTSFVRSPSVTPTSQDRIQELVNKGKPEAAAKLLGQELLSYSRNLTNQNHMAWNRSYELNRIRKKVAAVDLADEIIKQFDPADTSSHNKIATYADILEMLEKPKESLKAYHRALELRPKDDRYVVKVILGEFQNGNTEDCTELFALLKRNGEAKLIAAILSSFQDHQGELARRLNLAKLGVLYLDYQLAQPKSDISWANALRTNLSNQQNANNSTLPSLYARSPNRNNSRYDKESAKTRKEMHDQLCKQMMANSNAVHLGFSGLLASSEAEGEVDEQIFYDYAKQALLSYEKPKNYNNNYSNFQVNYSNYNSQVPLRTPGEFLVRHSWKNNLWESLQADVLDKMTKSSQLAYKKDIDWHIKICQCEEKNFTTLAKEFIGKYGSQSVANLNMNTGANRSLTIIFENWKDRNLEADIESIVLSDIEKRFRRSMSVSVPAFVADYAEQLVEKGKSNEVATWFDKVGDIYVGKLEDREKLIAKHYNQNQWGQNTPNSAMHQFGNFLQQALQRDRLLVPISRYLAKGNVAPLVRSAEHYIRQGVSKAVEGNKEDLIEYLKESQLLCEIDQIVPGGTAVNGKRISLYDDFYSNINRLPTKEKSALLKGLISLDKQTVGVLLFRCCVEKEDDAKLELLQYVEGSKIEIAKLEEDKKYELAFRIKMAVSSSLGKEDFTSKATSEVQATLDWMQTQLNSNSEQIIDRILAYKRLEEIKVDQYQLEEWVAETTSPLLSANSDKLIAVVKKVASLYRDAKKRGTAQRNYDEPIEKNLVRRLRYSIRSSPALKPGYIKLITSMMEGDEIKPVVFLSYEIAEGLEGVTSHFNDARSESKGGVKNQGAITESLDWMREKFGPDFSPLLIVSFHNFLQQLDLESIDNIESYFVKSENIKYDSYASEFQAALFLMKCMKESLKLYEDGVEDSDVLDDSCKHYNAMLQDASISLPIRIAVLDSLFELARKNKTDLPNATCSAGLQLGITTCESDLIIPFQTEQHFSVMAREILENDPTNQMANDYCAIWMKRYFYKQGPFARSNATIPRIAKSFLYMLRNCYLKKSQEDANKLIRKYEQKFGCPEAIAIALEFDDLESAKKLSKKYWNAFSLSSQYGTVRFNRKISSNVESLLEDLGGDAQKYLVKAALLSLNDPRDASDRVTDRREVRMIKHAKEFKLNDFKSLKDRVRVLMFFIDYPDALIEVESQLAEVAGNINLPSVAAINSSRYEAESRLAFANASLSARNGEIKPAKKLLDSLAKGNGNDGWRLNNSLRQRGGEIFDGMLLGVEKYNKQELNSLAELIRKLIDGSEWNYISNNSSKLLTLSLIANTNTDKLPTFLDWYKDLPEAKRKRFANDGVSKEIWGSLHVGLDSQDPSTLKQRTNRIKQFLKASHALKLHRYRDDGIVEIKVERKFERPHLFKDAFAKDEIPTVMQQLTVSIPLGGITACLAAEELHQQGYYEEALEAWAKADEQFKKDESRRGFGLYVKMINSASKLEDRDKVLDLLVQLKQKIDKTNNGEKRYNKALKSLKLTEKEIQKLDAMNKEPIAKEADTEESGTNETDTNEAGTNEAGPQEIEPIDSQPEDKAAVILNVAPAANVLFVSC